MTENAKTLPNLVVIGASKCGTTALHHYLDLHPEVAMSDPKEVNFFMDRGEPDSWQGAEVLRLTRARTRGNWSRGVDWYARHFTAGSRVRGESSPSYTAPWFPGVAERMASVIPNAKLIFLVRDPIDRMLSHWRHLSAIGKERRPVAEAFADPRSFYLAVSRYHEGIRGFLDHFPRDRVLVASQEDLLLRRNETMRTIYRFAGVDQSFTSPKLERLWQRGDEMGTLSGWRQRLERVPGAAAAYRMFPDEAKWRLQRLLARRSSNAQSEGGLHPALRRSIAEELRDDVARLRELAGREFEGWTV